MKSSRNASGSSEPLLFCNILEMRMDLISFSPKLGRKEVGPHSSSNLDETRLLSTTRSRFGLRLRLMDEGLTPQEGPSRRSCQQMLRRKKLISSGVKTQIGSKKMEYDWSLQENLRITSRAEGSNGRFRNVLIQTQEGETAESFTSSRRRRSSSSLQQISEEPSASPGDRNLESDCRHVQKQTAECDISCWAP